MNKDLFIFILIFLVISGITYAGVGWIETFFQGREPFFAPPDQKEISESAARDRRRIFEIKSLQRSLKRYYGEFGRYPLHLEDLIIMKGEVIPRDPFGEEYLYAVLKEEKPQFYHLGAKLESPFSEELELQKDMDYPSDNERFLNGFSGTDPVFDVVP